MAERSQQQSSHVIARAVAQVLEHNSIAALATLVEADSNVGAKLLVEETGLRTGSLGDSELDEAVAASAGIFLDSRSEARTLNISDLPIKPRTSLSARVMLERIEPEPRLVICGAGHVGASLARLAAQIGYRTTLIDDRAAFLTREHFPNMDIELVVAKTWGAALTASVAGGRGVSVAVVTRGHNEDEECMRALMSTNPDYVGLIGSKRRTNIVLERLREQGVGEERVNGIRAPIGLDIGAVSPQEVALAILAEIVAERRGGAGGSLSSWRRNQDKAP